MVLYLPEDSDQPVIIIRSRDINTDGEMIENMYMGEQEIVSYIREALERRKQHRFQADRERQQMVLFSTREEQ